MGRCLNAAVSAKASLTQPASQGGVVIKLEIAKRWIFKFP